MSNSVENVKRMMLLQERFFFICCEGLRTEEITCFLILKMSHATAYDLSLLLLLQ